METPPALRYRGMIFYFLREPHLTKVQRAVGMVLLLRTNAKHKFKARPEAMKWDRVAALTGYSSNTCKKTFDTLVDMGWIELHAHEDGRTSYRVPLARREEAREWNNAYWAKRLPAASAFLQEEA